MFDTPFDLFQIPVRFELTSASLPTEVDGIKHYRFNFHQNFIEKTSNLSIKRDADQMPEFNIAFDHCDYTYIREKKDNALTKITEFEYVPVVTWRIGLYREPENMLATVFAPIILLNLLMLGIYTESPDVGQMLGNVAMIVLALLAYMPIFRSSIPAQNHLTLGDRVIVTCLLNSLSCFLMIMTRYIFAMNDEAIVTDPLLDDGIRVAYLLVSIVLTFSNIFLLIARLIKYKVNQKGYDQPWEAPKVSGAHHLFAQQRTLDLCISHKSEKKRVICEFSDKF